MTDDRSPSPAEIVLATNLIASFAQACDHGSLEEYLSHLCADASIVLQGADGARLSRTVGESAIRTSTIQRRQEARLGPGSGRQHLLSAPAVVAVREDEQTHHLEVEVVTGWHLACSGQPVTIEAVGHYRDIVEIAPGSAVARLRSRTTTVLG